jgi:superfamily II RNA helicase
MDSIDDLFDIFNTTPAQTSNPSENQPPQQTTEQNPKRQLQSTDDNTFIPGQKKSKSLTGNEQAKIDDPVSAPSTSSTPSSSTETTVNENQLVSLSRPDQLNVLMASGNQKSSAELSIEDYDVFNGYHEQVVVGSEKPDNVKDQTQKTCAMQTCYPPLFNHNSYENKVNKEYLDKISAPKYEPAKKYPFTLDPFQAKAVECIEKNQSVLVAAHTSAGKTVVAEYAIAKSLKLGQRVIYTSPIKALSNQKYRELQAEFTDVGLMTGDVTINAGASCLVMTTEILRNMLYRGSEVLREISWVIFDEVHYMRDRSRGVVWEETIILLPHKCRFVFLSATLLNSAEFASWVAKVHNQPCSVIYTNYRPTPLEHYVCARGSDGLHLIVDKHGEWRDGNFQKAVTALADPEAKTGSGSQTAGIGADETKKGGKKPKAGVTSEDEVEIIVRKVKDLELDPCIVFSFSKKDCERYAKAMMKIDFCTEDERNLISEIYKRAINGLTEQDRQLPQVQDMAPLLKQGIGVHHGGLLPILKEVVELLFQEGLLRVLFSTETFSIGLNMPARTVVFTSMFKWDGLQHRALTSGEYIQMSGRAGRRGLDDRGVVILMLNQEVETNVVKAMMAGPSDPLMSSFRLGYNMLLNLTRLEEAKADHLMVRSFYQFQQQRAVPMLSQSLQALEISRQDKINAIKDLIARQIVITAQILKAQSKTQTGSNLDDQFKRKNQQSEAKKAKQAAKEEKSIDTTAAKQHPLIQIEDIQQYFALRQNIYEQRQVLRTLLHRPEFLRPLFTKSTGQLVHIKGCIREGPAPLKGSAAELALLDSYNQPLVVNNNDLSIEPLEFSAEIQTAFGHLRANRGVIDGDNAAQSANAGAANMSLVKQDDLHTETGIVPPGLGLTQLRLNQLAQTNKATFLDIQRRRLKDKELNFGWGIVVNVSRRSLPETLLFGAHTPIPASTGPTESRFDPASKNGKDINVNNRSKADSAKDVTIFDVLIPVDPDTVTEKQELLQPTSATFLGGVYALHQLSRPCPPHKAPKWIVVPILASAINSVSSISLQKFAFKTPQERRDTGSKIRECESRLMKKQLELQSASANGKLTTGIVDMGGLDYKEYDPAHTHNKPSMFPMTDSVFQPLDLFSQLQFWNPQINLGKKADKDGENANISSELVKDIVALNFRISKLHQQLVSLKLHTHPLRTQLLTLYHHKTTLDGYKTWLNYKLARVSKDKTLEATLIAMNRVLRNLQLVTKDDVITNKGRVACEVSTCDELVGTELLYSSIFNTLDVKQLAALCSCLVFDENSANNDDVKPKLQETLEAPYNQLEEHLKHVATIIKESSIPININDYIRSFNPFLMNLVFQWCEGATFATIMKNCAGKVFEGTVVRVMRRLEELMRQFSVASATLGNTELEQKFNDSIERIKRDIVFAASLYL